MSVGIAQVSASTLLAMIERGGGGHAVFVGRFFPATVSLVAMAVLLLGLGAPLAGAAPASAVASSSSQVRRALRFWTPARMRQAKPLEAHRPGRPAVAGAAAVGGVAGEVPRRFPPRAPGNSASSSSTFETVADSAAAGASQNGAIFIVLPQGGLARCSGTSVNAPNLSVVFTAGHCVNSGGPGGEWFDRKWIFVPGYRYGQRPFGVFVAKWLGTTREWLSSGSENFDVGAAVVSRNERGQRLAAAVGGTGIAFGLNPSQVFDVHGYPVAPPFNGDTQQICPQTPFLGHDVLSFSMPGPLNLAVQCNVTGGASGGGWTIAGGLLNSITDYGYPLDPATDFGAYFGKAVGRLFASAAGVR
jgi:hypothetical protein